MFLSPCAEGRPELTTASEVQSLVTKGEEKPEQSQIGALTLRET